MIFEPISHTYTHNGEVYQSVSSWIEEHSKPFHADMIAKKVATKHGRTKEDVLAEWGLKNQLAVDYGNAIHNSIELWLKYGQKPKHKHLINVVEQVDIKGKVYSEVIVFDEELKLAGTIDVIQKVNGKINLIDFKTNGDIEKENGGYLLAPLDHIRDTKINRYTVQLNLYRQMLENRGKEINKMELWYWNGEKFEIIKISKIKI